MLLELNRQRAQARLEAFEGRAREAATEAERAEEELARLEEELEEAERNVRDRATEAVASIKEQALPAKRRESEAWGVSKELEAGWLEVQRERQEHADVQAREAIGVATLLPIDPERPDPDALYARLRGSLEQLRRASLRAEQQRREHQGALDGVRDSRDTERQAIAGWRAEIAALPDSEARTEAATSLDDWAQAVDGEEEAHAVRVALAVAEGDDALRVIRQTKHTRRSLASWVSWETLRADRGQLLRDAAAEWLLLGPQLAAQGRDRAGSLARAPDTLSDFNRLVAFLTGSFWTLLAFGVWWAVRQRVDGAVEPALQVLQSDTDPVWRDLSSLRAPLRGVLTALLDLLIGWALLDAARALSPEVGLLLEAYLQLAIFRLTIGLFELFVVPSPPPRPALAVLGARAFTLARASLQVRRHRLVRLLSEQPPSRVWVPLQAVIGAGLLAFLQLWELLQGRAGEGDTLGMLFNALDRYRLSHEETEADDLALSGPAVSRLRNAGAELPRTEVETRVQEVFGAWRRDARQGVLLLTGDRGSGKTTTVERLLPALQVDGQRTLRARVDQRLTSTEDAVAFLARALSLPPVDSVDHLVAAMLDQPARAHVIEGLHDAFLREVHGLDAIRALLYVFEATAHRHFWLLTTHRAAWAFLCRLGGLLDSDIVQEVVDLTPMAGPELRELLVARTAAAGFGVDFGALGAVGPFGSDPDEDRERSIAAFFRLLAEASGGNPAIASLMWTRCLVPAEEDTLRVRMHQCLSMGGLDDLSEDELHVLNGLRTHDRLSGDELVRVTNLDPGRIRTTLQRLEQRELLWHARDGRLGLDNLYLPAVTRTLRRRHFLQWTV